MIKKKNPVWRFFHRPLNGVNVFIGNVGSGKTTLAAKFAVHAIQCGITVYSNIPELSSLPNCYHIEMWMIGHFAIKDGLLIVDEAGIAYNNRDALSKGLTRLEDSVSHNNGSDRFAHLKKLKAMNEYSIRFWKLIRHYHLSAIVFSQAQDFDVTIRRLASRLFIIQRSIFPFGFLFSSYKRLGAHWVIDQVSGDPRLEWQFIPLSRRFVFRPRWYKFFNSWSAPELPPLPSDPA